MVHEISHEHLSIQRIAEIIKGGYTLKLSEEAIKKIEECRDYLDKKAEMSPAPIYGVTTGFGSLCNISINQEELSQLQHNLVVSHACGTGDKVCDEIVKIILLLKIQSLGYGYSGVQLCTVQRLVEMYNEGVLPVIYELGSLGASGDLAPLAHLALPLLGLGEVVYGGKRLSAEVVNKKFGWNPITLKSKEGLALLNGTQFMCAHGVWSVLKGRAIADGADLVAAISLDAYLGRTEPFSEEVHIIRPHKGQVRTAANIRAILAGSEIAALPKDAVQDPYSFRCVPQVHGASRDTLDYVAGVIECEVNSTTDNPNVFVEEDKIISAGNFHGQPLALVMDFLCIAMAEWGSISCQRTYQLIAGKRGLPHFLVAKPGLNSGFMIPQYTAASIVSQNKGLSTPASVDSIESSQGQEDHVSMGANAATKLRRAVLNTQRILAIELFNACQALEFRRPLKSSPRIEEVFLKYRKTVPFINEDTLMHPHIESSIKFFDQEL